MNSTENGGKICASFPREGVIEVVNKKGKRKIWEFDQVCLCAHRDPAAKIAEGDERGLGSSVLWR